MDNEQRELTPKNYRPIEILFTPRITQLDRFAQQGKTAKIAKFVHKRLDTANCDPKFHPYAIAQKEAINYLYLGRDPLNPDQLTENLMLFLFFGCEDGTTITDGFIKPSSASMYLEDTKGHSMPLTSTSAQEKETYPQLTISLQKPLQISESRKRPHFRTLEGPRYFPIATLKILNHLENLAETNPDSLEKSFETYNQKFTWNTDPPATIPGGILDILTNLKLSDHPRFKNLSKACVQYINDHYNSNNDSGIHALITDFHLWGIIDNQDQSSNHSSPETAPNLTPPDSDKFPQLSRQRQYLNTQKRHHPLSRRLIMGKLGLNGKDINHRLELQKESENQLRFQFLAGSRHFIRRLSPETQPVEPSPDMLKNIAVKSAIALYNFFESHLEFPQKAKINSHLLFSNLDLVTKWFIRSPLCEIQNRKHNSDFSHSINQVIETNPQWAYYLAKTSIDSLFKTVFHIRDSDKSFLYTEDDPKTLPQPPDIKSLYVGLPVPSSPGMQLNEFTQIIKSLPKPGNKRLNTDKIDTYYGRDYSKLALIWSLGVVSIAIITNWLQNFTPPSHLELNRSTYSIDATNSETQPRTVKVAEVVNNPNNQPVSLFLATHNQYLDVAKTEKTLPISPVSNPDKIDHQPNQLVLQINSDTTGKYILPPPEYEISGIYYQAKIGQSNVFLSSADAISGFQLPDQTTNYYLVLDPKPSKDLTILGQTTETYTPQSAQDNLSVSVKQKLRNYPELSQMYINFEKDLVSTAQDPKLASETTINYLRWLKNLLDKNHFYTLSTPGTLQKHDGLSWLSSNPTAGFECEIANNITQDFLSLAGIKSQTVNGLPATQIRDSLWANWGHVKTLVTLPDGRYLLWDNTPQVDSNTPKEDLQKLSLSNPDFHDLYADELNKLTLALGISATAAAAILYLYKKLSPEKIIKKIKDVEFEKNLPASDSSEIELASHILTCLTSPSPDTSAKISTVVEALSHYQPSTDRKQQARHILEIAQDDQRAALFLSNSPSKTLEQLSQTYGSRIIHPAIPNQINQEIALHQFVKSSPSEQFSSIAVLVKTSWESLSQFSQIQSSLLNSIGYETPLTEDLKRTIHKEINFHLKQTESSSSNAHAIKMLKLLDQLVTN